MRTVANRAMVRMHETLWRRLRVRQPAARRPIHGESTPSSRSAPVAAACRWSLAGHDLPLARPPVRPRAGQSGTGMPRATGPLLPEAVAGRCPPAFWQPRPATPRVGMRRRQWIALWRRGQPDHRASYAMNPCIKHVPKGACVIIFTLPWSLDWIGGCLSLCGRDGSSCVTGVGIMGLRQLVGGLGVGILPSGLRGRHDACIVTGAVWVPCASWPLFTDAAGSMPPRGCQCRLFLGIPLPALAPWLARATVATVR